MKQEKGITLLGFICLLVIIAIIGGLMIYFVINGNSERENKKVQETNQNIIEDTNTKNKVITNVVKDDVEDLKNNRMELKKDIENNIKHNEKELELEDEIVERDTELEPNIEKNKNFWKE